MISLIQGDALHIPLADETVQCVVTSPPYYGLRDYNVSGQIGLEQTPEEYVTKLVDVFREVWRVLRDDGTVWLNLGDSYGGGNGGNATISAKQISNRGTQIEPRRGNTPKQLLGIPWRVAFALQADGWYLRSDIIWHKPNPMPESVRDRPTKSHEYLFLLSKSQRYYYDQETVREVYTKPLDRWGGENLVANGTSIYDEGTGQQRYRDRDMRPNKNGRNRRTVWTIPTSPYSGAHFATFPPALVEPCILAGTSERGCCPNCGKPWERVVEHSNMVIDRSERTHEKGRTRSSGTMVEPAKTETIAWRAACSCLPAEPVPCTVLDPFAGTFTVGMVAAKHRRNAVGIELKREYIELARKRCSEIQVVML